MPGFFKDGEYMSKNIRAVFWDIDGTMVMSEPVHEAKMGHIAGLHKITLPDDVHARFHGAGDYVAYQIMCEHGFLGTQDDFLTACSTYYQSQLHTVNLRDGFMSAFTHFEDRGIVQCAVSNGTADLVVMNIDRAGIQARLAAVVDLDYVESRGLRGKPAADPYLEALRLINEGADETLSPEECLVIEDSMTGVKAAKAAGMKVIFWKLLPELSNPLADFEAHTAEDIMDVLHRNFG